MTPSNVVDASVLAATFFKEERAAEADALLRQANGLAAPPLIYYELTNIARTKARQNPSEQPRIARQLQAALRLNVTLVEVDFPAVLELALEKNLSAYDASYLFVARQLNAPVLTFDDTLAAAAP